VWNLAGGKPIQNRGAVPVKSALSEEISKILKKRGFKFVGPVIVYAWMQATGIVNDHAADCFRRNAVRGTGESVVKSSVAFPQNDIRRKAKMEAE
jgi:DNA-3-methyladenine glycosylase I